VEQSTSSIPRGLPAPTVAHGPRNPGAGCRGGGHRNQCREDSQHDALPADPEAQPGCPEGPTTPNDSQVSLFWAFLATTISYEGQSPPTWKKHCLEQRGLCRTGIPPDPRQTWRNLRLRVLDVWQTVTASSVGIVGPHPADPDPDLRWPRPRRPTGFRVERRAGPVRKSLGSRAPRPRAERPIGGRSGLDPSDCSTWNSTPGLPRQPGRRTADH
jgi:hypothetical protein